MKLPRAQATKLLRVRPDAAFSVDPFEESASSGKVEDLVVMPGGLEGLGQFVDDGVGGRGQAETWMASPWLRDSRSRPGSEAGSTGKLGQYCGEAPIEPILLGVFTAKRY